MSNEIIKNVIQETMWETIKNIFDVQPIYDTVQQWSPITIDNIIIVFGLIMSSLISVSLVFLSLQIMKYIWKLLAKPIVQNMLYMLMIVVVFWLSIQIYIHFTYKASNVIIYNTYDKINQLLDNYSNTSLVKIN